MSECTFPETYQSLLAYLASLRGLKTPHSLASLEMCEARLAALYFNAQSGHWIKSDLTDLVSRCGRDVKTLRLREFEACLTCEDPEMAFAALTDLYDEIQLSVERECFCEKNLSAAPLLVLG